MAITALPSAPSTSDPTNFATKADALIAALPQFVLEVNAIAALGIGTPAGITQGNTASIATATATTFFAIPNSTNVGKLLFVRCVIPQAGATNYTAYAIVISDGANARIAAQSNGSLLTITLSGQNLQVTQTSGSGQVVAYGVLSF